MISIYLFTKKSQFIFSISFVFNFQKSYLHLLYQNNLSLNFKLATKIIFTCFYKKKSMNFYNFIFKKKYFDLFSFKKSDLYKLFKKKLLSILCEN